MDNFFTIFQSTPTPNVELDLSVMKSPIDITDWAERVTPEGDIIPKGRVFGKKSTYLPDATTYISDEYYSNGSRAEYAKLFFLSKAELENIPLKDYQAAAIVGNFMLESGSKDLDTKAIGDNGASIGIGLWLGSRRKDLMNFANKYNLDVNNLDTLLEFTWYEMTKGNEAKLYKTLEKLLKTTSIDDATKTFMETYERPRIQHLDRRIAFAKSLLQ